MKPDALLAFALVGASRHVLSSAGTRMETNSDQSDPLQEPQRIEEGSLHDAGGRAVHPTGRRIGRLSWRRLSLGALKLILIVHLVYIALTSTLIIAYRWIDPPFTILMPYRSLGYGWKLEAPRPLPLKSVPAYLRTMLIAVEDGKFYDHFGIDFEAFKRAREINERVGKPLYGGSTLTMQVARTLFLVPEKSYVRKYFEVIAALELELFLSKNRILELYFGYAEWGKGIFGIEAAARHWYGKGVASLTRDEGARLIALLSSPIRYSPTTLNKSGILRERYAYLLRRFVAGDSPSVLPDTFELPPKPLPSPEPGVLESSEPGNPSLPVGEGIAPDLPQEGAPVPDPIAEAVATGAAPATSTDSVAAPASDPPPPGAVPSP
jgi:monofunctional biosynthetic peptidoglycan transglycosylase